MTIFSRLPVFILSLAFIASWHIGSVFSQEDDPLNSLLLRMQRDSVVTVKDSDPDQFDEPEDEPIISPDAPAIHSGTLVPVGDPTDDIEIHVFDEPAPQDDEPVTAVPEIKTPEITRPQPSLEGLLSPRPQRPLPTPEPLVNGRPATATKPVPPPGTYVGIDALAVGCAFAPQMLKVLNDEIINGLNGRNVMGRFNTWRGYAHATLNNTNSTRTGTEVNSRARLSWYDEMYRDPLAAVFKADHFSR